MILHTRAGSRKNTSTQLTTYFRTSWCVPTSSWVAWTMVRPPDVTQDGCVEMLPPAADPRRVYIISEYVQPAPGTPTDDEAREGIATSIMILRALHDTAPIKSSVTRACRLDRQSNWTLDRYISALYDDRSIMKERSGSIQTSDNAKVRPAKRNMADFLACQEDTLGLWKTEAMLGSSNHAPTLGANEGISSTAACFPGVDYILNDRTPTPILRLA